MAEQTSTATVVTKVNGEQAENELKKLQDEARELRTAIAKAYSAGDTRQLRQLEKALRENQRSARVLKAGMLDVDKVLANLKTSSVSELQKALRSVTLELNSGRIARGSAEWDAQIGKIRELKGELAAVQAEQGAVTSRWGRMVDGFNRYAGVFASVAASVTGVTLAIGQMNSKAREKEESAANLKALTGLDDESIGWLTGEAERLSMTMTESGLRVRQSAQEILDAYTLVGSAKPELLSDKEALASVTEEALRLAIAARMDLTEAVDAVTLSMNQYGAAADEAARYTNVMAAGSKFGSAAVQSVTASVMRAGVAASSAGVPIEALVGTIETLAEKGIKDEVAGTGLKKFFLTLQTGADETNPKVVGLSTALRNLEAQQLSAAEIKKRFGEEGYNVATVLINEADKVEYYTEAVTGTAVATEQAAINSSTAAAKLAQMKNELTEAGIAIAKELSPYVLHLGNGFKNVVVTLTGLIKLMKEWGVVLATTGTAIAGYTLVVKANTVATRAAELWNNRLVKSFRAIGAAIKANPWGVAITAVAALGSYLYTLYRRSRQVVEQTDAVKEAMDEAGERYAEQRGKVQELVETVNSEVLSLDARRRALAELKKIVPGYHADLTEEGTLINNNKEVLDDYLISLERQIQLEAVMERLKGLYRKKYDAEEEYARVKEAQEGRIAELGAIGATPAQLDAARKSADGILSVQRGYVDSIMEEIGRLEAKYKEIGEGQPDGGGGVSGGTGGSVPGTGNVAGADDPDERYKEETEAIKAALLERTNALRRQRADDLITEEDYTAAVKAVTMESLQETVNATRRRYGEDSVEYQEALGRMLDARIDFDALVAANDAKFAGERQQREEEVQKRLAEFRRRYGLEEESSQMERELALLESFHAQQLLSEEDYQKALAAIRERYRDENEEREGALFPNGIFGGEDTEQGVVNETFGALRSAMSATDALFRAQQEDEEAAIDAKYDREIERAGDNRNLVARLEAEKEREKSRVQAKYADKQFGIQLAMSIADAAAAIVQCFAELGPVAGAIAAAGVAVTTGLQIATITQQRNAARQNYWRGGFTPDGDWDEPQGTVHSGEFVANRFAVRNPSVRRVLNVIDAAQRSNTVGALTAADVSRAIDPSGYAAQMMVQTVPVVQGGGESRMAEAAERLARTLDRGITAVVSIEGRDGFEEQYTRYKNLKKNASWSRSK